MVKKWRITIPTLSGDETRRVYLYLPESYQREPDRRYPVMYMFDGHNVFFDSDATFGKSWGMAKFMTQSKKDLIIVAVECNHQGNGRIIEYSPMNYENATMGRIRGKGGALGLRTWLFPGVVRPAYDDLLLRKLSGSALHPFEFLDEFGYCGHIGIKNRLPG